jgi:hypothetical protein
MECMVAPIGGDSHQRYPPTGIPAGFNQPPRSVPGFRSPHQLYPCDAGVDRTKRSSDWELYFTPSTSKARSNETPDSDRMLRRRNVLSDLI